MKIKYKFFFNLFFLVLFNNLFANEIIRDPIFEDYIEKISYELELKKIDTYLIKNESANAFVIDTNIYFTTGLLEVINNEDTLKAIYLHEYGHVVKNHFQTKKIQINQSKNKNALFGLFSVGLAVITGNAHIGIGSSITLNNALINEVSRHSVNFEIEADNFMIDQLKKNKINTSELISFLKKVPETNNKYFITHPRNDDRINNINKINNLKSNNSDQFEWIKSKYSYESNNDNFNIFFKNLEKGIYYKENILSKIKNELIQYEAFKKGFFIDDWQIGFESLLSLNNSSFLKIEYINYLLDNNIEYKYYIIEDFKFDKNVMKEYFYNYIYGKYYDKVNNKDLSNFYFCQFYRSINSFKKSSFYCEKYDIKDIPTLDKSYALFK